MMQYAYSFPKLIVYHSSFERVVHAAHSDTFWEPKERRIEERIEEVWREKEKNPNVWNGRLVRLDSSLQTNRQLCIRTSLTDYRHHCGTRDIPNQDERANPIYVLATVLTSDNKLAFGLRENTDNHNGRFNVYGGAVDPLEDMADGHPSLISALRRELQEELGIKKEDIGRITPYMVIGIDSVNPNFTPNFHYTVRINLNSPDLSRAFETHIRAMERYGELPEMIDLKLVADEQEAVMDEIQFKGGDYTDIALAILMQKAGITHTQ